MKRRANKAKVLGGMTAVPVSKRPVSHSMLLFVDGELIMYASYHHCAQVISMMLGHKDSKTCFYLLTYLKCYFSVFHPSSFQRCGDFIDDAVLSTCKLFSVQEIKNIMLSTE